MTSFSNGDDGYSELTAGPLETLDRSEAGNGDRVITDIPAGGQRRSHQRVQSLLPCHAGPWRRRCGRPFGRFRTIPVIGPVSTTWRSPRSTRRGSCSSTTTRGCSFATSFDGPWDAYMDDFFTSGPTLALFDAIFQHVEGYEGLPDLAAVKAFVLGAQETAAAYARNYGGTVKEIRKAERVNEAFQQVLDDPDAASRAATAGAEAVARRGRRLGTGDDRGASRCRITSRDRGRSLSRSRTSPMCTRSPARSGPAGSCSS